MRERAARERARYYALLLTWAVSLTPPAERDRALPELDGTAFTDALTDIRAFWDAVGTVPPGALDPSRRRPQWTAPAVSPELRGPTAGTAARTTSG